MRHPKPKRIVDQSALELFRHGSCELCHRMEVDPCHIKSRGSGGPDAPFNLIRLCREHHSLQHSVGWIRMMERFPILILVMKVKGWSLDPQLGLVHPELMKGP